MHVDGVKTVSIRSDAPGEITAGDIQAGADIEILDSDVHIATVSEGGALNMEMRVKRGRGYVSADKNFDEDLGIGWIPVDSVHSPIKKVNYLVEAGSARPDDRLRQADDRRMDRRDDKRPRRGIAGGEAGAGPPEHLHRHR